MTCFGCESPASHEIRGIPLCPKHYIEALEYSAHIVSWVNPETPDSLQKLLDKKYKGMVKLS